MIISRKNLGLNVRFYREALRLSQSELAHRAMVSRRAIQNVENGTANPCFDFLASVTVALNITLSQLFEVKLIFKRGFRDLDKIDFYGAPNSFFTVRNCKDQIIDGNSSFEKVSGIKLCDFADNIMAYIGQHTETNFELITEKQTHVFNRSCSDIVGSDFERIGRFGYGFAPGSQIIKTEVANHFWKIQANLGRTG